MLQREGEVSFACTAGSRRAVALAACYPSLIHSFLEQEGNMASRRRQRVDIYLLGRGIADGVSQMTFEAMDALRASRLVFDLSGDAKAIRKLHQNVVDLSDDYWTGELCDDVYKRLEETVIAEVRKNGPAVAIVVDGHPMLFDDVNWSLLRNGKRRRLNVVAIPGIS